MKCFVKGAKFFLLVGFMMLPCALLLTEAVLYSQNSIYLDKKFVVQKRMMKMTVMGGDEFLLTRFPLAQNQLNLGQYFGFQQVFIQAQLNPEKVEFKFQVPQNSYLDFVFNRTEQAYSGLRLSRRTDLTSLTFESDRLGRFTSQKALDHSPIAMGWHKAVVQNSAAGLTLVIDNATPLKISQLAFKHGQIGFRSGGNGAIIDDITVNPKTGKALEFNFRTTAMWPEMLVLNLTLLILLVSLTLKASTGHFFPDSRQSLFHIATFAFCGIICSGIWYLYDYNYLSLKIPTDTAITRQIFAAKSKSNSIEGWRLGFFGGWYELVGGERPTYPGVASRGYPTQRIFRGPIYCANLAECKFEVPIQQPKNKTAKQRAYRLLVLGGSQTIGAGAETPDDSFFVQLHRLLSKKLGPKTNFEAVNAAVSGHSSAAILQDYKMRYLDFHPDLVLINVGVNDTSTKILREKLSELLRINQARKIKTMLVLEPKTIEFEDIVYNINHEVLRELGAEFKVPVLDLHEFLAQKSTIKSGALWWDFVHLTSYGQRVTAEWLAPRVLKVILSGK